MKLQHEELNRLAAGIELPSVSGLPEVPFPAEPRLPLAPGELRRIFVVPDTHFPNHDKRAWACCLAAIASWRPHDVVHIGDLADCYTVSFHPKDPQRQRMLKPELLGVNAELDELQAVTNAVGARTAVLEGNHDARLTRWLAEKAPELFGLLRIEELLRIRERGWSWTPYRESLSIGCIDFVHDIGYCGKHAAEQSLAAYGRSLVFGHSHRGAIVYSGEVAEAGHRHVCMNVGCLIDISTVDYRHQALARKEWQHGFGAIEMTADGVGFCNFVPIIDGRCVLGGKEISA